MPVQKPADLEGDFQTQLEDQFRPDHLVGLGTYTYASGHFHGASSTGSGNSYVYDNNGNMTQRNTTGGNFTLSYDVENRLTGVSGAESATFVYDGDGNRVKATVGSSTTTYYVGDCYEIQGSTVRKYYYAGGQRVAMNENSTVYWLLSDHLGSSHHHQQRRW